jgi:hypothetical protein
VIVSSSIVVIGPAAVLPALRARLEPTAQVHEFTDAEALEALDHVFRHRPRIIAIEREFSDTARGTALINRLKDDPALAGCEVRVVAHDASHRQGPVRPVPADDTGAAGVPLDSHGTRRAPRVRIEPVEVLVDGNPAQLIDLSVLGAQVLSPSVLKPNQRVRFVLSDAGRGTVRCQGAVAWATFEMPKGQGARYRAGIEFSSANADAITAFAERHKARG